MKSAGNDASFIWGWLSLQPIGINKYPAVISGVFCLN